LPHQSAKRENTSEALVPSTPKLLEITVFNGASRWHRMGRPSAANGYGRKLLRCLPRRIAAAL
jgi:hypothetical protein